MAVATLTTIGCGQNGGSDGADGTPGGGGADTQADLNVTDSGADGVVDTTSLIDTAVDDGDVGTGDVPPDAELSDATDDVPVDTVVDSEGDAADSGEVDASVAADIPDVPPDVVVKACEFKSNPAAGEDGAPCATDADCTSGSCIASESGYVCAPACATNCCPTGWACEKTAGTPMCKPKWAAACMPCLADAECSALSPGSLCIKKGDQGSFCGTKCSTAKDCPADYKCSYSYGTAANASVCVLSVGVCECSGLATAKAAKTTCSNANTAGTCKGERACVAAGLQLCDAKVPAAETCNAQDDDCNGKTDDGLVNMDLDQDGIPDCTDPDLDGDGTANAADCAPAEIAIHPGALELCNGADDNCDASTDEGFSDLDTDGIADCMDTDLDGDGVPNLQDCVPKDGGVFQNNAEVCDGKDQNCNGKTDEDFGDVDGDKIADCMDPDIDGDGVDNAADCSPTNAAVFPGGSEVCDGADNNCSGQADEGFGNADGDSLADCVDPDDDNDGALDLSDCATTNAAIHPGAVEVCNGVDDNCDGQTDPGCDDDKDGYCDAALPADATSVACPNGAGDCDDEHAGAHPGATEVCDNLDNDCNGETDPGCDTDGDGYCVGGAPISATCPQGGGDCNDADKLTFPGGAEVCDGKDQDCDGTTDDGCDSDADGYCAVTEPPGTQLAACPLGDGDCADNNKAVNPGASDTCNSLDDNCDGVTDAGCDQDGDGFCAGTASPSVGCIHGGGDCNDGDAGIHPGVTDLCDDIDNDCNGQTDQGCDDDGDGWCNTNKAQFVVGTPSRCVYGVVDGVVTTFDCNDAQKSVYPGAPDLCDGLANGCDNILDADCNKDGDFYCDAGRTVVGTPFACLAGGGDCDDNNPDIYPTNADVCDLFDNDCDGQTDPGCDADGDGFCAKGKTWTIGSGACKFGAQDCNDNEPTVYPNAAELCDNFDNNCDSNTDDGCDDDEDGYCDINMPRVGTPQTCLLGGNDCNDTTALVTPGHAELCDDYDNDCNGQTDTGCDKDDDGFCDLAMETIGAPAVCPSGGGDCDDNVATIMPGSAEICDGKDNNCLAGADEGCNDDGDSYCDAAMNTAGTPSTCPSGGGDCDDLNSQINPALTEVCDDVDNNCKLGTDEGCDDDGDKYCDGQMVVNGFPKVCAYGPGDCNDTDPLVGAIGSGTGCVEICDGKDNNNDGQTDEACDKDSDGYCDALRTTVGKPAACPQGGADCNDNLASVNPGMNEKCNTAIDDNCDGLLDSNGATGCTVWYVDADNDTYGGQQVCYCNNPGSTQSYGSVQVDYTKTTSISPIGVGTAGAPFDGTCPVGYVGTGVSGLATVSPIYLGQFNLICRKLNADGSLGVSTTVASPTFGTGPAFAASCPNSTLLVSEWGDQNGTPAYISRLGGHCSTLSRVGYKYTGYDDYLPNSPILLDGGGTGSQIQACPVGYAVTGFFGNGSDRIWQLGYKCSPVTLAATYQTYVQVGGDCNDGDAATKPTAAESCDNIDNNCNGTTDDACDVDGDKYCTSAKAVLGTPAVCSKGGGDCADNNAAIYPGATELCNAIDDDCNYTVDPGCNDDGDEYCDAGMTTVGKPATCVKGGGDCNDTNNTVYPTAGEKCDDLDNDCGGVTDEGCDDDGDQYCDANYTVIGNPKKCPKGKNDCADGNFYINSGVAEVCDNIDNNCASGIDENCDADGDGWCRSTATFVGNPTICTKGKTDCNDGSNKAYPGAPELCDNLDNACNGTTDAGCDDDNDDYCDAGMTYVGANTCTKGGLDCNDSAFSVNPGAKDICGNGIDDDCSGPGTVSAASTGATWGQKSPKQFTNSKWQAFAFTPNASGTLSSVSDVYLDKGSYGDKNVSTTVRIYAGGLPGSGGTQLGSSSVTVSNSSPTKYSFSFGGISLTKNATYYAVIFAADANSGYVRTNDDSGTTWASDDSGGSWTGATTGAFTFNIQVAASGVDGPVCQ